MTFADSDAPDVELPAVDNYAAVIDQVPDCLAGHATARLAPASVLDGLELTLVHHTVTATTNA